MRRGATDGGRTDDLVPHGLSLEDSGVPWLNSALKSALKVYDPVPEEVRQAARSTFAAHHRTDLIFAQLIGSSGEAADITVIEDGRPVRMHVFQAPGHTIRIFVADGRVRRLAGQIDPAAAAEARVSSGTSDMTLMVAEDGRFAIDELDTGPLVVTLALAPGGGMPPTTPNRVVLRAPVD